MANFSSSASLQENANDEIFIFEHLWSEYVELIFNVIVIILGIPTNCWSLWRYWKLWKADRVNGRVLLGLNLTLANFSIILLYCTWKIAVLITIVWPWGETLCKVRSFCNALVYHLSSNAIVIIAWEMFYTFHRTLQARVNKGVRRACMQIFFASLFAALCSGPQLWTWGVVDIPEVGHQQCDFLFYDDSAFKATYELGHVISVFYTPLTLIAICYVACGVVVRKHLKNRQGLQESSRSSVSLPGDTESTNQSFKVIRNIISYRAKRRTRNSAGSMTVINSRVKRKLLKVSIIVITTYVLCWLPYQALSLWSIVLEMQFKEKPQAFQYMYFMEALLLSTVLINPLLYTFHGL